MVLDASAVLALLHDEPGADLVEAELDGGVLSAVNLAEVLGKVVDTGGDVGRTRDLLRAAGVVVEPLGETDAALAGALRQLDAAGTLSLGDRCCLAVALRTGAQALTADRAWAGLDLPVTVRLVR